MSNQFKGLLVAATFLLLSGCDFSITSGDIWRNETQFRAINFVAPQIDVQNTDEKGVWTNDLVQNLNYREVSQQVKFDLGNDNQRDYLIKAVDSNSREDIVTTHRVTLQQGMQYLLYQYGDVSSSGFTRPLMKTSQIFTSNVGNGYVRTRFIHVLPSYAQEVDIYLDNYKQISELKYGFVSPTRSVSTSTGGYLLRVVKAKQNPDVLANQLLNKTIYLDNNSSYQIFISPASANGNGVDATLYREPTQ
ncbi:DUF4397 domain-containing protein [Motilimonas cestriensis]|uniref:DUF4397 domain-containing protein n=1 Tax=Motilimonas cestriensis TaxID=2742685 RepID=A0ABS8WA29_9GAMM|nr:DUF4397 domain-containing protein [Motilimonas cestriensis]MCE2594606.1 DUF4397 domain-containing protein [Motilimonas cestriensis]